MYSVQKLVTIKLMSGNYKQNQHSLIVKFHELQRELRRDPTPREFCESIVGGRRHVWTVFKNWEELVAAAGAPPVSSVPPLEAIDHQLPSLLQMEKDFAWSEKTKKMFNKICSKKEQIQGFFRHTLDLKEMFERAGNPASLRMVGQGDTHVKFKDAAAVKCYIKFLQWYQPDVHLIFGDFADCEGISHWPSDSLEPRRLIPELVEARTLLKELVAATPKATTRIFLEGNHEDWINQAFARMPEFFDGIDQYLGIDLSVKTLLNLDHFQYQLFPVNHLVQIGNAHFTHGIYTAQHHAKKHLEVYKCNIYYGHLHDDQVFNATSIYGNLEAACVGCLCRLDAKFLKGKPNNWRHLIPVWEFFPDGRYVRYFIPITEGKCSFVGQIFDGNI